MEKNYEPKILVLYTFENMKDYLETKEEIEKLLNLSPAKYDRKEIRSFEGVKTTNKEGISLRIGIGKMGISGKSYDEINFFRRDIINEKASVIEEKVILDKKSSLKRELENFFNLRFIKF